MDPGAVSVVFISIQEKKDGCKEVLAPWYT